MRRLLGLLLGLLAANAGAVEGVVVRLDTRPGVSVTSHYLKSPAATATLLLLTGGSGSISLRDGEPHSSNFLIRNRELFAAEGFNVFSMGRPSDRADLDGAFRSGPEHVEDLRLIVAFLKEDAGKPVWLVGTSLGTVSATAGAIALGNEIAGVVLTSSITSYSTPGAPATQALGQIKAPVLVMHHERDECRFCRPHETSWIVDRLRDAPIRKRLFVNGGRDPSGPPCEPMHWHGFINMDEEAVRLIAAWIRQPTAD